MKTYQLVFSPTGGTEKAAAAITKNWPQVRTIDLSLPDTDYSSISIEPDALVLVAMPCFGGVAPQLALDRFARIKGNGATCVLVAVYGNRAYENTLVQMHDTAQTAGFRVIAAVSAVAEHSIIHQYAAGRPNAEDREELARFGTKILEKAASDSKETPEIPGKRPYKTSGGGMVPTANASCTGCGLCAQRCPAQAISPEHCKTTEKSKCIGCMRCVSICPVHARSVNHLMVSVASLAIKKACSTPKANELFL